GKGFDEWVVELMVDHASFLSVGKSHLEFAMTKQHVIEVLQDGSPNRHDMPSSFVPEFRFDVLSIELHGGCDRSTRDELFQTRQTALNFLDREQFFSLLAGNPLAPVLLDFGKTTLDDGRPVGIERLGRGPQSRMNLVGDMPTISPDDLLSPQRI